MLTALNLIAERKIRQAIEEGTMADLSHWKNKPLPEDDMGHVPADLRMAYRILKNAGYIPEEVALQKEIVRTEDLLARCADEKEKYKQLKKLNYLRFKLECRMGKNLQVDVDSPYYDKVVNKMTVKGK
ncbi:hypothetical protein MNBD_DELTA04-171 [hydrothermal vent metagenome]|uniref:DnaJ homologue subfamily C member 28 conserved domain-containing protein n=1 Tax=hydrothermal vent metagenome TaxID=652676 RepID=A0A3B0VI49_9ZZZZ